MKESTHGAPYIAPIDVPEHIRPKEEASPDNGYIDDTHYERWAYVLDEMIWAFDRKAKNDYLYDESYKESQMRMSNGFRLFGKYYEALWN